MSIINGFLTYEAEGTEGGRYHSRKLHVPSDSSGLTIGRGYDLKEKSAKKVSADLHLAGLPPVLCQLLSQAAGLSGESARNFIVDNKLEEFEISMEVQEALFNMTYEEMTADVRRICHKHDCVAAYGNVDWDALDPKIKDLLVDLRYRGDYTPAVRKRIQQCVASNDVDGIKADLTRRDLWQSVPEDRFKRRVEYF